MQEYNPLKVGNSHSQFIALMQEAQSVLNVHEFSRLIAYIANDVVALKKSAKKIDVIEPAHDFS